MYEGEWKDDKMHGSGKWTWGPRGCTEFDLPGSTVYEGEFKDSMCHGSGTLTYPDGGVLLSKWTDNKLLHSGPLS